MYEKNTLKTQTMGKLGTTSIRRAHRTSTRRKCSNLIFLYSTKCLQCFNYLLYIYNFTIQFLPCIQCVKTAFFVNVQTIWKLLSPLGEACVHHLSTTVICCNISRPFIQYLCDVASICVCSLLPNFSLSTFPLMTAHRMLYIDKLWSTCWSR